MKSRLDRFLLSKDLIEGWKIVGQKMGDWDISDHAPVWLKANDKEWGPKPFRVNNCWFEVKGFKSFVEATWCDMQVRGNLAYISKEKFKRLKSILRVWNKVKFGWIELNIEEATKKIKSSVDDIVGLAETKEDL